MAGYKWEPVPNDEELSLGNSLRESVMMYVNSDSDFQDALAMWHILHGIDLMEAQINDLEKKNRSLQVRLEKALTEEPVVIVKEGS